MKAKHFCELKNLTVPVAMTASIENAEWRPRAARHLQPYVRIRRCLGKSPGRATTRTGKISTDRLYGPRMRRYQPPPQVRPSARGEMAIRTPVVRGARFKRMNGV